MSKKKPSVSSRPTSDGREGQEMVSVRLVPALVDALDDLVRVANASRPSYLRPWTRADVLRTAIVKLDSDKPDWLSSGNLL